MSGTDTIAALATPAGAGALAVVRISGPGALEIAGRVSRGRRPLPDCAPGSVQRGRIEQDGVVLDEVLLTVFRAPRS
jgi:tRNA modification GTPase